MFQQAGGEVKIFRPFDLIQENLDIDTVKILGFMSQGKSVEYFQERLESIKMKLNNIDNTI